MRVFLKWFGCSSRFLFFPLPKKGEIELVLIWLESWVVRVLFVNYWWIHVLFQTKFVPLRSYLPSVPFLWRVKDICLLTEKHVAPICHIFCYFGSRSPVLNPKACIWAVHLNIVVLFICPMRGLFIISSYHRITQWNVLNIRVWEPVHFFRLWRTQWIELIVVALYGHWCNFSVPFKTRYLVFKTTGLVYIKISEFGMDEIFANNHIWEVAHNLRVIIHQLASVVWSRNVL